MQNTIINSLATRIAQLEIDKATLSAHLQEALNTIQKLEADIDGKKQKSLSTNDSGSKTKSV